MTSVKQNFKPCNCKYFLTFVVTIRDSQSMGKLTHKVACANTGPAFVLHSVSGCYSIFKMAYSKALSENRYIYISLLIYGHIYYYHSIYVCVAT